MCGCLFVALGIQQATHMRHSVICGLPDFKIFVSFFLIVLSYVLFVSISLLFVCKCVLYYCQRESTQLQLQIYHIINFFPHYLKNASIFEK
jgi:hypothetical protein